MGTRSRTDVKRDAIEGGTAKKRFMDQKQHESTLIIYLKTSC